MCELVDRSIAQLLEDLTGHRDAVYNQRSDPGASPSAATGSVFYAVVREPLRVILLRLVTDLR